MTSPSSSRTCCCACFGLSEPQEVLSCAHTLCYHCASLQIVRQQLLFLTNPNVDSSSTNLIEAPIITCPTCAATTQIDVASSTTTNALKQNGVAPPLPPPSAEDGTTKQVLFSPITPPSPHYASNGGDSSAYMRKCPIHTVSDLEFYCQACETLICKKCAKECLKTQRQTGTLHTFVMLDDTSFLISVREELAERLNEIMYNKQPRLEELHRKLTQDTQDMSEQKNKLKQQILDDFNHLLLAVGRRRSEMLSQAETSFSELSSKHSKQTEVLHTLCMNIQAMSELAKKSVSNFQFTEKDTVSVESALDIIHKNVQIRSLFKTLSEMPVPSSHTNSDELYHYARDPAVLESVQQDIKHIGDPSYKRNMVSAQPSPVTPVTPVTPNANNMFTRRRGSKSRKQTELQEEVQRLQKEVERLNKLNSQLTAQNTKLQDQVHDVAAMSYQLIKSKEAEIQFHKKNCVTFSDNLDVFRNNYMELLGQCDETMEILTSEMNERLLAQEERLEGLINVFNQILKAKIINSSSKQ